VGPVPRLLVIAGSDSSAGAGLQADLKTAQAFGVYAQTAVTAVTAQNTRGVRAFQAMPPELVRAQIDLALEDIGADAIKIGMLGNGAVAAAVADALEGVDLPLVLDPVLLSSSGVALLDAAGVEILKTRLLPRATLLTPNLPEAQALVGIDAGSAHGVRNAMQAFALCGARYVLFKGGHDDSPIVRDVLAGEVGEPIIFEAPRQPSRHTHGTGCTLATAIACGLAEGTALKDAVARAHAYVQEAIRTAPGLGEGCGPLNHSPR
jgi:hydroxymethylpyrimidine/phosphomethylpyrimidine kinase